MSGRLLPFEAEKILDIVRVYGGDQKPELRKELTSLIKKSKRKVREKIKRDINQYFTNGHKKD